MEITQTVQKDIDLPKIIHNLLFLYIFESNNNFVICQLDEHKHNVQLEVWKHTPHLFPVYTK